MIFTAADIVGIILLFITVCISLFGIIYSIHRLKYGERCYRLEKLIPLLFYLVKYQSIEDAEKEWYRYVREYHSSDNKKDTGLP